MAKKKSLKVDDRIKKNAANNKWFQNAAKSMGFTAIDVVKDLMPNTSDFVDYNKADAMDMMRELRSNTGSRQMVNRQFRNIPQVKAASDALKNIKADLKSGNLNNKARQNEFDFDDMDFNFGVFDENDQLEFIDDNDDDKQKQPVTVINTLPLAKMINAGTEATVSTMVAVADQQMAIESEKLMFNHKSTKAVLGGLSAINDNLAILVKFNAESTAKFHAASLKFYEETADYINRANDILKKQEKEKAQEMLANSFSGGLYTFTGGVKLGEYKKLIEKNIKDMKDENAAAASAWDTLKDPGLIKQFAKNPIGTLMSTSIKLAIPTVTKAAMKKVDESLASVLPAVLAKINSLEGNENPLYNLIYKVFGSKNKLSYDVNLGDYDKGAMAWDGESKKALVEVIPTYLRRIESALTGQEERIYNYNTGRFSDRKTIKKEYEQELRNVENYGFTDVKTKMRNIASQMKANSNVMDQFEKDMEEYFSALTKKGSMINPFKYKDKDGFTVDELMSAGLFNNDPKRMQMLRKVMQGLSTTDLTKIATANIYDSRNRTQNFMDEIRRDPNKYGYSSLYNDDSKNKAKYDPNKKPGMYDKFERTQLDYLRDIRSALIHGIKVFPDTRKRYSQWEPNSNLLKKEREEQKRFDKNRKFEETKKKEKTNYNYKEIFSMSDEELNAAYAEALGNKPGKQYSGKIGEKINKFNEGMNNVSALIDAQVYKILFGKDAEEVLKGKGNTSKMAGAAADTSNNVLGKMKTFFADKVQKTKDSKFGSGLSGLVGKISNDFMDGFRQFKVSLFGKKAMTEKEQKETMTDLMTNIKSKVPTALKTGFKTAMLKTVVASNLGILGSILLPGGPLGAALIGTTTGFLKQSETFKKWMFGDLGEDGKRKGGFIPKDMINLYDKYGVSIKKGATAGFLASFLLPGGPIAGSLLGIGASIASKNEAFQELLFGKDYKNQDKKSIMNGAFGKLFKNKSKNIKDDNDNTTNTKLATFLGGSGLAVGIAQGVGLLPSMLLPGGPILGSLLGLAAGITASSNKFQKFLFGEKDEDGKRSGGLLTKFTNWFDTSVVTPLKIKATEINDKIYGFLRKKVFDPIVLAFEPIKQAGKFLIEDARNAIIDSFTKVTEPVVNSFREHVTKPLGKMMKTLIVNPIARLMKGTFSLLGKFVGSVVTSPLKLLSGVGAMAERYNERHVLKGVDTRGMSKEEKQELLNQALEYRNGMTRRQRKKAAKKDLKDEMKRRADRRAEMQRQYEEDKKFGKETGWTQSRKNKSEDKQSWLQEKIATETEDTGKKVSKVTSTVEDISKDSNKGVSLLSDIKDSLKEIAKAVRGGSAPLNKIGDELKKKGQSHEDGLDSVPKDGYIAELHKGEMVVPKKPAGLLRNMFSKGGSLLSKLISDDKKDRADNALGLTDEEVDQMNEIEDRNRYKQVSRKSIDYIMNLRKQEKKEKEEKKWKTDILSAIYGVGDKITASASKSFNLMDLLGNLIDKIPDGISGLLKGLGITGTGAVVAADMYVNDWIPYKNSEEYRESRTDGEGLMVYDNADASMAGKFLHKGTRKAFLKPLSVINDKLIKPTLEAGKTTYNVAKKAGSKGINGVSKLSGVADDFINPKVTAQGETFLGTAYKYTGDVVDKSARKGIAKPLGKVADAASSAKGKAKDMVSKFISLAKEAMGLLSAKVTQKFPKAKKITNCVDDIFNKLLKDSDSVFKKFSKKIAAFFTDLGLDFTGVGTVAEFATTAYDFLSGLTAGNTGNLFGVSPENVDTEMRAICSLLQGCCQFSFMAVIWIINEMTNSMYGVNFLRQIAVAIYKALPNVGKTINLNSKLKSSDVDSSSSIDEVLQKAGVTDTSKYKDKNGNWVDFSKLKLDENDELSARDLEEVARYQYNQQNGTKLDSDAWIDKNSQTLGSKILGSKWMKNFKGSFQGDSIRGHMGLNKDAKLTFKDRFLYAGGSTIVNTTNAVGKLFGIDSMKNWTTEQMFSNYSKRRTKKYERKLNSAEEKIAKLQEKNENTDSKLKMTYNNALIKYYEKRAEANRKKLGTAEKEVKKETKSATTNANNTDYNSTTQKEKDSERAQRNAIAEAQLLADGVSIDESYGLTENETTKKVTKTAKSKAKTDADKKIENSTNKVSSSVSTTYDKFVKSIKTSGSIISKGLNSNIGRVAKTFSFVTSTMNKLTKKTTDDMESDNKKALKELNKGTKGLLDGVKNTISGVTTKVKDVIGNIKNINVSPISVDTLNGFFGNLVDKFLDFFGINKDEKDKKEETTGKSNSKDSSTKKSNNMIATGINKVKDWLNLGSAGSNTATKDNNESGFIQTKDRDKYVFYSQSDDRWGKTMIGDKTMSTAGCGPTSLAMAISQMTGEAITPDTIAKMGKDYLPGYSSYGLFPEIAKKFNMNYYDTNNASEIASNLQNGVPVILSGKNTGNGSTPYTDNGHIVVANSIDGENVFVSDPRGKSYSKTYKLSNLMSGLNKAIVLNPTNNTKNKLNDSKGSIPGIDGNFVGSLNPTLQGNDFNRKQLLENLGSEGSKIRLYEKIIGYAKAFEEKLKYSYGSDAIDRNGMTTDCSAFTRHVFKRAGGIDIPRSSAEQLKIGTKIPIDQAQAGDLVLWNGHSGLVVDSNGNMIDAGSGSVPKTRSFMTDYWKNKYGGTRTIRRVLSNPNELVDATVTNPHTGIGFSGTVNPQGGGDISGGGTSTGSTESSGGTTSGVDQLGAFGKMGNIAQNMMASIFNGKQVDLFAGNSDSTTTSNTGGTVDISGESDYATGVWKFLIGKGYSPQAAAGILGNMTQESGVDPTVIQGGGKGPAAGICQWENWRTKSSRWKAMSDYASSKGKDWTDLQSQLEWLDLELQGKDPTTLSKLKSLVGGYEGFKSIKDVNKATEVFEKAFERAGKPNMPRRYSAAKGYYDKFANGGASLNGDNGPVPTATSAQSAPGDGSIPTSMNGWAYYKQGDSKWQEDIGGKKIGPSGCGMASHAMMLTSMFGKEINPVEVGKFGRAKGLWSNGMSWSFPAAVAKEFNLDMSPVVEKSGGASKGDLDAVKAVIKNGRPVVLSGKGVSKSKSPFTTGGHIVLAVGVDGNNRLIINDPRGPEYTRAYEDSEVMDIGTGLRGAWSFDTNSNSKIPDGWKTGSDFSAGSYSGTTDGTTDGTTGGSAPAVDQLGAFGKMGNIAQNMMASIFNGKQVDLFSSADSSDGTTNPGGVALSGGDFIGKVSSKYEVSYPTNRGDFISNGASWGDPGGTSYGLPQFATNTGSAKSFAQWLSGKVDTKLGTLKPNTSAFNSEWKAIPGRIGMDKFEQLQGQYAYQLLGEPFGNKWLQATGLSMKNRGFQEMLYSAGIQHGPGTAKKYAQGISSSMSDEAVVDKFYDNRGELNSTKGSVKASLKKRFANERNDIKSLLNSPVASTNGTSNNDNAGMGEGDKVKYNKINTDKGGEATKLLKASQREVERMSRLANNSLVKAYDDSAINKVCIDMLNVIVEQLQAINNNTADTAKGVNDIKIVSANEPVNNTTNTTGKTNVNNNTNDLRQANQNTGYDIARRIASFK